jgi:hypothetical protein
MCSRGVEESLKECAEMFAMFVSFVSVFNLQGCFSFRVLVSFAKISLWSICGD